MAVRFIFFNVAMLNSFTLCVTSVPAAAGPVLPNGLDKQKNHAAIKQELLRLQHVSKQAHINRSVQQ